MAHPLTIGLLRNLGLLPALPNSRASASGASRSASNPWVSLVLSRFGIFLTR